MREIKVGQIKITSLFAAYIPKEEIAIVADLHIGYEGVLQREGVTIPKYQKEVLLERLGKILKDYRPKKLIINGDFKHEFGRNLRQEWREATEILEYLAGETEVLLIRGNHDNFLRTIASKLHIPIVDKYEMRDMIVLHGHKETSTNKKIIMAHEHPSLALRDKVGAIVKLPCYMISKKIIVLPALSPLATGTDVISDASSYLSPILQTANIDDFEIYAISHDELLHFSKIGALKEVI